MIFTTKEKSNMIPECSILRRHYLTEIKYTQEDNFNKFMNETCKEIEMGSKDSFNLEFILSGILITLAVILFL